MAGLRRRHLALVLPSLLLSLPRSVSARSICPILGEFHIDLIPNFANCARADGLWLDYDDGI
jgi:hypothetical protein